MKSLMPLLLAFMFLLPLSAQEKGSYISVKGGMGSTGLQYNLFGADRKGVRHNKLGWNAEIGYQYFFHNNWGIATGVGISYFRTLGTYPFDFSKKNYFDLGMQTDDDLVGTATEYQLRVHLQQWEEIQKTYFIEIPLMLMYQQKFGEKKTAGFYIGAGAKLQIPIQSKYRVMDADYNEDIRLRVTGYYEKGHLELGGEGDPQLPQHGFGGISNPYNKLDWQGNASVKLSVALAGEAGFLIGLGRRVDLILAAYVDYGLNNIKKTGKDTPLMLAPEKYLSSANSNVGGGITYNGMVESDRTDRINTLAYGGKIGLRVKLGKLSSASNAKSYAGGEESPEARKQAQTEKRALDSLRRKVDVLNQKIDKLLEQPRVVEKPAPAPVVVNKDKAVATFRGVVTDSLYGNPLAATVEVSDKDGNLAGVAIADPNTGAFSITDIPLGKTYSIDAKKPGYSYYSQENIQLPAGNESVVQSYNIKLTKLEEGRTFTMKHIFFETAKADLKEESMKEIEKVYQLMIDNPTLELEIDGHTDDVGGYDYNQNLSKNRAAEVMYALIRKGVSSARLKSAGFGYDRPVAPNDTPEGRSQNRRVEFKVLKR